MFGRQRRAYSKPAYEVESLAGGVVEAKRPAQERASAGELNKLFGNNYAERLDPQSIEVALSIARQPRSSELGAIARFSVEESEDRQSWPVRLTYETGIEDVRWAHSVVDVERLAEECGIIPEEIVWRGNSLLQIRAGIDPSRP